MVIDQLGIIIGYAGTITGLFTTLFFFRRARKAEVQSKEIATADQMIELVKKANAEAAKINRDISENNRIEIERLRNDITKLERAINAVKTCPYHVDCPVSVSLQNYQDL